MDFKHKKNKFKFKRLKRKLLTLEKLKIYLSLINNRVKQAFG